MNIHLYLLHTLFLYILKYAENSKKLIVNAKKKNVRNRATEQTK